MTTLTILATLTLIALSLLKQSPKPVPKRIPVRRRPEDDRAERRW